MTTPVCGSLLLAAIVVATATPSAARSVFGGPPWTIFDRGPHWTTWQIEYQWSDGKSVQCGPNVVGDGWECQAAVPNKIQYTGESAVDFCCTGGTRVDSIAIDILRAPIDNVNYTNWRDGIWRDCYPPTTQCRYSSSITNGGRTYNDYEGGYFWGDVAYNYRYWNGSGWTPTVANPAPTGLYPYSNGPGLHLQPIVTNATNQPPVATLGAPNGAQFHRDSPDDVRVALNVAPPVSVGTSP